jgi:hypothetical protein
MLVSKENVLLLTKGEDGEKIMNLMSNDEMKCTIIPSRNFSFDCQSVKSYSDGQQIINSYNFDGKKSMKMATWIGSPSGTFSDSSGTCDIK